MITVRQILDAAYAKSAKTRPSVAVTEALEGIDIVIRAVQGLYAYAARVNPIYFAGTSLVGFGVDSWARPAEAETIFRIETTANPPAEVVVVPFDDRKAEPSKPAVYELGQKFYPAGNPFDPVSGNLTFWYSKRPTSPAAVADPIDASWCETYNELVILEVALYLAIKDGRQDDRAALTVARDHWLGLYTAFLEHATSNLRSRFSQVRRFTTQTLVPLKGVLAGGGTV